MGADLFIQKLHQSMVEKYMPAYTAALRSRDSLPPNSPAAKAAQAEVERCRNLMLSQGYFRDAYNLTSVLYTLGLSWWDDVMPLCTKDQLLHGKNLEEFRRMVATAKQRFPSSRELNDGGAFSEGKNLAEWHRYFVEQRHKLLDFLDQAIALKAPIYCWL